MFNKVKTIYYDSIALIPSDVGMGNAEVVLVKVCKYCRTIKEQWRYKRIGTVTIEKYKNSSKRA